MGRGQVGHAIPRKIWLGPSWFVGSDSGRSLKIAAHEAFNLLQYEVTREAQWFGGVDVRPAGPWWLLEGAPEYFAFLAVVEGGTLRLADVRLNGLLRGGRQRDGVADGPRSLVRAIGGRVLRRIRFLPRGL